ncbi:MAG: NAD(P)H-hydrate dehydratase [Caloramator sp.]|jgi:NAD(P)H-hydrate epimerase|uniref:NAD(P)H-hydrate dehydratase n=1 Tax=Caloramator sp. TaxID=1871330 RepID=UPI001DF60360|nr:NAD(P)H-hydrate dehydratase [Caloramator sp.]MBZ4664125.1 NAD(P)H-hydrate dehydratase [Caloramator sp.]
MKVSKAQNMRNIDRRAMEKYKIPGIVLMENAAWALFKRIKEKEVKRVLVVCGVGNNGGDGFALSRLLMINGYDVSVYLFGDEDKIKGDARINYDILLNMGVLIKKELEGLKQELKCSDVAVDALFGTGLDREVEGIYKEVIEAINLFSKYIISVDIPSGINSDTGLKMGSAVFANETVTFGTAKLGLLINDGREHSGTIYIDNISIPKACIDEEGLKISTNYSEFPKSLLKKRHFDVNKGSCGKVAVIGGCFNMSGAVTLTLKAALRTGSGLVTGVVQRSIVDRIASFLPEATYRICNEKDGYLLFTTRELDEIMQSYDAVAVGVGIGRSNHITSVISYLLEKSTKPLIIDADGLNMLCSIKARLKTKKCQVVLTPHPGEFSRLTGLDVDYINKNRVDVAVNFAKEYGCILLLKGASTVVTDGDRVYINTTGNPGMATGGSGDILTGVILSLIGQGYTPYDAALLGAYLHGCAGDFAYKKYGNGLVASDIIEYIGQAML